MKILELTNFSAGGCGVFARVKEEAKILSKKHEVQIFSSNYIKGSLEKAPALEKINNVNIKRFSANKLGGESFMRWDFEKEAISFSPDVIIAHSYRHPHTIKALKIGKKIGAKVVLVTHAPFARNTSRSIMQRLVVYFYDFFIGVKTLRKFDKVVAITNWEKYFLKKLKVSDKNIVYIPNGVHGNFFKKKLGKETDLILYAGRIAPIKNLQVLISSMKFLKRDIKLELFGPCEEEYKNNLLKIIKEFNLNNVSIKDNFFNNEEEIKKIDVCKIFVLPSKSEGMPQVLIEAMARKKIVVGSDNFGNADIIVNGKNGLLFKNGNDKDLAEKINTALIFSSKEKIRMKNEARKTAEQFSWKNIEKKLFNLLNEL